MSNKLRIVFRKSINWGLSVIICILVTSSMALAAEYVGELAVSQVEDLETGFEYMRYDLNLDSTNSIQLFFNGPAPEELVSGMYMSVLGDEVTSPQNVLGLLVSSYEAFETAYSLESAAVAGTRAVIAIRVNFSDQAVGGSVADIANTMWEGASNVNGWIQETSYGALSFPNDVDLDGNPDVIDVIIPNSIGEACSAYSWATAAEAAAVAQGVNLALYRHRLFVLPSNVNCSWAGLANVGCGSFCRAWVARWNMIDVYQHELGHNLGMSHSSVDDGDDSAIESEYGDVACFMGYGGIGPRHSNSVHKLKMGWMPEGTVQTVSASGTFTLAPLELTPSAMNPAPPSNVQVVQIAIPDSPGDFYVLSYRRQVGDYSTALWTAYRDRTSIHRFEAASNKSFKISDPLNDGESFTSRHGIVISQVSNSSTHAVVSVTMPAGGPTPPAPPGDATPPSAGELSINGQVSFSRTPRSTRRLRVVIRERGGSFRVRMSLDDSLSFSSSVPRAGNYRVILRGPRRLLNGKRRRGRNVTVASGASVVNFSLSGSRGRRGRR